MDILKHMANVSRILVTKGEIDVKMLITPSTTDKVKFKTRFNPNEDRWTLIPLTTRNENERKIVSRLARLTFDYQRISGSFLVISNDPAYYKRLWSTTIRVIPFNRKPVNTSHEMINVL